MVAPFGQVRCIRENSAAVLAALLLLLAAGFAHAQQDSSSSTRTSNEQRAALVIGNGAYPFAKLRNATNDARAMADKLKALGFDVTLRTDITRREMDRAIVQFGESLSDGGVALFYFAGHGMQVRGKNFLIPVDAEINMEASVRSEGVDVDQVLDQLGPSRLSMVILDACRSNPFERRFRGLGDGGLAQIDAPKGTLIAYATAPGKTALDGTGANGLYTQELLRALDKPGLRVEDVFKQVRINVSRETKDTQIPWEASSLVGEFVFRADTNSTPQGERAKREEEERVLKLEMEKMRTELVRLKGSATIAASGTDTVTSPAAGSKPSQFALAARPADSADGVWSLFMQCAGFIGWNHTLLGRRVTGGKLAGRAAAHGSPERWELAFNMPDPDRVEVVGTLTDAQGKSGRYAATATATVPDATFKGPGKFADYDCTFEARRIK
jgi:Caspase domain